MPRRSVLTERQRSALFDLPTDETNMLRLYILADDDLEHINARRRPENRIGFALQLCALRYPGRLLSSDEIIPEKVLRFIAAQLGLSATMSCPTPRVVKLASSICTPFVRSTDSKCSQVKARAVSRHGLKARPKRPVPTTT